MTLTRVEYQLAPSVTQIRGTVLDAATVGGAFPWIDGLNLFDSYHCLTFRESAALCEANAKTLDQAAGWQSGLVFSVYGGVACKSIGLDQARMKAEVAKAFEMGEHVGIEQALMEQRFVANIDTVPDPDVTIWEAPEDITPASGAVSPKVGAGLLEGHAASSYVGAPTLHMPRSVASILIGESHLEFSGSTLRTKLGSKVAAGGGYDVDNSGPTGAPAAAGERWLYATGEVLVNKSELIHKDVFDQVNNDVVVMAERSYLVTVDCYTAAIRITLED